MRSCEESLLDPNVTLQSAEATTPVLAGISPSDVEPTTFGGQ